MVKFVTVCICLQVATCVPAGGRTDGRVKIFNSRCVEMRFCLKGLHFADVYLSDLTVIIVLTFFLDFLSPSSFIPPQNVVYFLMLHFLVHKIFTFYINGVLNCKCPAPGPKG